ncbi:MAG TPA: hypothetical protein VFF06_20685 [Polyangia bacterium]|nr:hypothetical protein [Polyangia bacterium]
MADPKKTDGESQAAAYDTFDDYLRLAIKEFYDRGWKNRRANFIALLMASGQTMQMARQAVTGEKGLRNVAAGAVGVVALRLALRWALGGPLGILLTAATGASLIAYFIKNQKEIQSKVGKFRERITEERTRFDEIQSGYRSNRYDARERNLMVDGQLKRFLADLDAA